MMGNIKVQFKCSPSEFIEMRDKKVWISEYQKLILDKSIGKRRKEGWIDRLVNELDTSMKSDYSHFNETESKIIIELWDFNRYGLPGESQGMCCEEGLYGLENIKNVLKKFRIKNYELIYEFSPRGCEKDEWMINSEEGVDYELTKFDDSMLMFYATNTITRK